MGRTCVMTMVWNESARLPRWLSHYGAAVGPENLVVLDDGSDDGSTEGLDPVCVRRLDLRAFDERERAQRISALAAERLADYDTVVYVDADELLLPFDGSSLGDWLSRPHPPTVTAIGLDLLQVPGVDPPLDPLRPLLLQRAHARLNPTYCKPSVTRVPIRWRPGFHFSDAPTAFDGLLLLHTRFADREAGLRRLAQLRTVEVADAHGFSGHWAAQDDAFTAVLDASAGAPWREMSQHDVALWAALLTERLRDRPPNAVEHIRHLWDEAPSWFVLPRGLRCDG